MEGSSERETGCKTNRTQPGSRSEWVLGNCLAAEAEQAFGKEVRE